MEDRLQFREHVLASCGAAAMEIAELLAYNENVFSLSMEGFNLPLDDEPFVDVWGGYADEVANAGTILPLADHLVQFRFPIEAGMSETPEYVAATRRGRFSESAPPGPGCGLISPQTCRLVIHPTSAGRIPLIIAGVREDFVTLVRALTHKNEPAAVPLSMGATMVAGFNNWHRIHVLRREYERRGGTEWDKEFQNVKAQKHLYQDRFIILSRGPYSGTTASDLQLDKGEWLALSLLIRREHECAHYFTRRVFSSMRNNLLDELIADYFGVTAAAGSFRADWVLRFFGLELFPQYRTGGRMENYLGKPPLSGGSFKVLQTLLLRAAHNVEIFDRTQVPRPRSIRIQAATFAALAGLTMEELASEEGPELLRKKFAGCLAALAPVAEGLRVQTGESSSVTELNRQERKRNETSASFVRNP
jgi:hypothetical protein